MDQFKIEDRTIGGRAPTFIVGEVAQAHDGSLGFAHAFIDAIAEAGADAVKFQTHIAAAESTPAETFRVNFSFEDATRYDYWKRMEFTKDQWEGLARHAREKGLIFLSSPFSVQAVDLLHRIGMPAWKIPSGEVGSTPMFNRIVETGQPILLSTGMSPWQEIDDCVHAIQDHGLPLLLLQCTSAYPCPPEQIGLNVIDDLRSKYGCPVGLSDHSGKIYAGLAATARGVDMIEVHVTLSRKMFGPDVPASLTPEELAALVTGAREINTMLANPVDKDQMAREMGSLREMFFKSVVAARDLPAGTEITRAHLAVKKPGTGIPASRLESLLGCTLKRDVRKDELIQEEDLRCG
jgi:N,N'-diacetyllegionaminate synthase